MQKRDGEVTARFAVEIAEDKSRARSARDLVDVLVEKSEKD